MVTFRKKNGSVILADIVESAPVIHSDGSVMTGLSPLQAPQAGKCEIVLLDARSREDYDYAHIMGALPAEEFDGKSAPDEVQIIIYGQNARDERPFAFLRRLVEKGCKNAKVLQGGLSVYRTMKMPLESTPEKTAALKYGMIIDIRERSEFITERVKGAVSLSTGGNLERDGFTGPEGTQDILVYGGENNDTDAIARARFLLAIRYDQDIYQDGIVAYAKGGFKSLRKAGVVTESGEERKASFNGICSYNMTNEVFSGEIAAHPEDYVVLDVRAGSPPVNDKQAAIPLEDFPEKAVKAVPRGKKIVAFCDHGARARIAARILIDNGYEACFLQSPP